MATHNDNGDKVRALDHISPPVREAVAVIAEHSSDPDQGRYLARHVAMEVKAQEARLLHPKDLPTPDDAYIAFMGAYVGQSIMEVVTSMGDHKGPNPLEKPLAAIVAGQLTPKEVHGLLQEIKLGEELVQSHNKSVYDIGLHAKFAAFDKLVQAAQVGVDAAVDAPLKTPVGIHGSAPKQR